MTGSLGVNLSLATSSPMSRNSVRYLGHILTNEKRVLGVLTNDKRVLRLLTNQSCRYYLTSSSTLAISSSLSLSRSRVAAMLLTMGSG